MKVELHSVVNFLLLLILFTGGSITNEDDVASIVGGTKCNITQHPYLVTLQELYSFQHYCGGTLVNSLWVLTAAHCCSGSVIKDGIMVHAGISTLHDLESTNSSAVRLYVHPKYKHKYHLRHDICLVELEKEIKEDNLIKYVKLADPKLSNHELCQRGVAVGFGDQIVKDIDKVNISVRDYFLHCIALNATLDESFCLLKNALLFEQDCFCVPTNFGEDICQGDSGGPFMCDNVQYGISSYGLGCGLGEYASVFVNILHYNDFIWSTIEKKKYLTNKSALHSLFMYYQMPFVIFTLFILLITVV